MNKYETLLVVKPDLGDDEIAGLMKLVGDRVEGSGGREIAYQNWGKRKLAYELRDNSKGVYLYFRYLADGTVVAPMQGQLRITENVLRFLTVKLADSVDAATFDFDAERAAVQPFGARRRPEEPELAPGEGGEDGERRPRRDAGEGFERDGNAGTEPGMSGRDRTGEEE